MKLDFYLGNVTELMISFPVETEEQTYIQMLLMKSV